MGDINKTVSIKFTDENTLTTITEKTRNYTASLERINTTSKTVNGQLTSLTQTQTSLWSQFTGGGNVIQGLAMRFVGLQAIIGMAQKGFQELRKFIDDSVQAFRAFEVQMASVNAILTDTTRKMLPAMQTGIVQLSVAYGKSVTELSGSLHDITQAGFGVTEAMDVLNVATKLAVAGNIDLKSATDTLTEVLNAYGLGADHAAEISDKLFQTMARGSLTLDSLQSALGYVLPIASDLSISFDQISSAISTATRAGQHIDSVTRGLGLMLQGFDKPTKAVSDAMLKYGINVSAATMQSEGFIGVMEQINKATTKYGMQILPELIGNMRSLRVAMALTSDSGISGMTSDMDYLTNSTGRTDSALTSMMNTQQKLADILAQSMQKVERSIGDAWSGVDIWWKKSQLWWGTLFSGGNADKAVNDFQDTWDKIRQTYLNGLSELSEKTPVLSDFTKGSDILGKVTKYNALSTQIVDMSKLATTAAQAKETIGLLQDQAKKGIMNPHDLELLNGYFKDLGLSITTAYVAGDTLDATGINFSATISDLNNEISKLTGDLTNLTDEETTQRAAMDALKSSFEDAATKITDTEATIVTLNSEMTTFGDIITANNTKLKLMQVKQPIEEFAEASKMAEKYGTEFFNSFTNTSGMEGYIKTIYDYNTALDETKKETEKLTQANHDLQIQMEQNNIQELKLELAGMMRRRGNTRAEQREMKQLRISDAQLRIQELQNQYTADTSAAEATVDAKKTAYEEATSALQKYTDFEAHSLFTLEDTRQADIDNLNDTITAENIIMDGYKVTNADDYATLAANVTTYTNELYAVASDPDLAKQYKKLMGTDAFDDATLALMKYKELLATLPTPGYTGTIQTNAVTVPLQGGATASLNSPNSNIAQFRHQMMNLRGYAGGTDYVPSTGIYQLHQGEKVTPAGQSVGNVTININNPTVSNPNDLAKLSNNFENIIRANLINKQTGKSKYRMS